MTMKLTPILALVVGTVIHVGFTVGASEAPHADASLG